MYRGSKLRIVRDVTVKTAVAGVVLLGAVAAANAIRHQPTTPTSAAPVTATTRTTPVVTTGAARATLVATPAPRAPVTTVSGVVSAFSGTSLTVRTTSGALTYGVTASTTVFQGRVKSSLAVLKVGTRVFVVSSVASPTTASAIGVISSGIGHDTEGGSAESDN